MKKTLPLSTLRAACAVALMATLVTGAAGPAEAAWLTPRTLSPKTVSATAPAVVMNGRGDLVVAWQTGAPEERGAVMVRRRPAGGGWGSAVKVSGRLRGGNPVLAVDAQGRIAVAWATDQEGLNPQVVATAFAPGRGWAPPKALTAAPDYSSQPDVAMTGGVATVVFVRVTDNVEARVVVARRSAAGRWAALKRLSGATRSAGSPSLEVDGQGRATVVYSQGTAAGSRLTERHEVSAGTWHAPTSLSPGDGRVTRTALAETVSGDAVVLWTQDSADLSTGYVQMAHRDGSLGSFGAATTLSPTADFEVRDLVVSANATDDVFTMGWWVGSGTVGDYIARRRSSDGSLTPQQVLALPTGSAVQGLRLATDAQQTTYAVWSELASGVRQVAARQLSIAGTWGAHEWAAPLPSMTYWPAVAVTRHHPAAFVWLRRGATGDRVQVREFDPLT